MTLWVPSSTQEFEQAVREQTADEGTHLDFKGELKAGDKAARELAIDIAAMSVAGGVLAIGVATEQNAEGYKRHALAPVSLAGLRERVSQIALTRIDPPVPVTTRELHTGDGVGYFLVLVSPSPDAPHMVESKYRSRSDTTNYVLGDGEVRRIRAERTRAVHDIATELDEAIGRDPTTGTQLTQFAHLFIVARPVVTSGPEMLQRALGADWAKWIKPGLVDVPNFNVFAPDLPNSTGTPRRRPRGWAAASYDFNDDRTLRDDAGEDGIIELEIDEDGALRLYCSRAAHDRWAFEDIPAGLTWRVVRAASLVADKTSYFGNWDFAVALTNTRGMRSYELARVRFSRDAKPYAEDEYRQITQATYAEITGERMAVVRRLIGRLNRALNNDMLPLTDFDARSGGA